MFPHEMGPRIYHLPGEDHILKAGSRVKMSEAEAMRFVAKKTSIPVPAVHASYIKDGNGYILMSKIPGNPLRDRWNTLQEDQRASVIDQLKKHVDELELLKGDFYGALWNLASEDIFFKHCPFPHKDFLYGPYYSQREYNDGLVEALANSRPPSGLTNSDNLLIEKLRGLQQDESNVFSHGDLHLSNILVDDDCRVTGIIDWEGAGFSFRGREYFETKSRARNPEWADALEAIFRPESRVQYDIFQELNQALTLYTGF